MAHSLHLSYILLLPVMFMLAHMVIDGFEYMLVPLLPLIKNIFLISYTQIGILLTALRLADSIGQTPWGYIIKKYNKINLIVTSITLAAIVFVLFPFTTNYMLILLTSTLIGLCISPSHICLMALIAEYFPKKEKRGKIIGLFEAGSALAQFTVTAIVNATVMFLGLQYWGFPFFIWSSIGFMFAYIFLKYKWGEKIKPLKKEGNPKAVALRNYSLNLTLLTVANALRTLNYIGVSSFLLFFLENIGVEPVLAGIYLLVLLMMRAISMPIGGVISDRFGRKKTTLTFSFAGTLLLMLLTISMSSLGLLLTIILLSLVLGMLCSTIHSYASDIVGNEVSSLTFYLTSGKTASAFGPFIMGVIADLVGLTMAFRLFAVILVLIVILISFTRQHD